MKRLILGGILLSILAAEEIDGNSYLCSQSNGEAVLEESNLGNGDYVERWAKTEEGYVYKDSRRIQRKF